MLHIEEGNGILETAVMKRSVIHDHIQSILRWLCLMLFVCLSLTLPLESRDDKKKKPVPKKAMTLPATRKNSKTKSNLVKQKSNARTKNHKRSSRKQHAKPPAVPVTTDIRMKQEELKRLRSEIELYQQRLASTEKMERNTLNRLDVCSKQTMLLKKLLTQIQLQAKDKQREIDVARNNLLSLEKTLKRNQEIYARHITGVYMRGPLHDTELLLSSASMNQVFIRSRYLRAYTEKQRNVVQDIRATQSRIRQQQGELQQKLSEQKIIIAEKKNEEVRLVHKTEEHKLLLGEVRTEKDRYQKQLERKQSAMREIESMVARLIERERKRRQDLEQRQRDKQYADRDTRTRPRRSLTITELPSKPISETTFGRLRGRLPWPLQSGAVLTYFGNQVHPTLGTVTINKGIDITSTAHASVRCIADGIVSVVTFIPGFGHIIIINHEDDFYSVYAHVENVLVRTEQRVKAGQAVAAAGQGESGSQMHFELWRARSAQNPIHWLSAR